MTITTLRRHRAERAAHRQLRRELATYSTPAEIVDLLAAVDRDDAAAVEVRTILQHNLQNYYCSRPRLAG